MRVLFLGSPEFSVPSLEALVEDPRFSVLAVITQPDRKAGRGHRLTPPPVKSVASQFQIPVFQFPRIRGNPEVTQLLKKLRPEIMVVVAFGQILPPDFFEFPPHGTLNVHASLLPKYRGAAPIAHAILNGERETGVTIMRIDEGMDTGDMLAQRAIPISESVSTGDLEPVLAQEGAALLMETIEGYARGEIKPEKQSPEQVSYASRISKEDSRVRWGESGRAVHNHVRAMNPWPVATSLFRSQLVKIWRTEVVEEPPAIGLDVPEGTIVAVDGGVVVRCAGPSYVSLTTLQLPNRNKVSARDFINGTQLKVGEKLI